MRYITLISLLFLIGCKAIPPEYKTDGGDIALKTQGKDVQILIKQPQNAEDSAFIKYTLTTGEIIEARTGSSRKNNLAELGMKLSQYQIFSYVGAGITVIGIGLTIASFWFPLIPKLAGPLVFGGGVLTAYMSTAIPDYGPYFLLLSLIGCIILYYHWKAGKKDPKEFEPKRKRLQSGYTI